jgi:hypothetical protein
MQTFLRHASTGQYFQSLDGWTPDRDNAHDFGLIARAVKFAQKTRLPNLELILSFDDASRVKATPFIQAWRGLLRNKKGS